MRNPDSSARAIGTPVRPDTEIQLILGKVMLPSIRGHTLEITSSVRTLSQTDREDIRAPPPPAAQRQFLPEIRRANFTITKATKGMQTPADPPATTVHDRQLMRESKRAGSGTAIHLVTSWRSVQNLSREWEGAVKSVMPLQRQTRLITELPPDDEFATLPRPHLLTLHDGDDAHFRECVTRHQQRLRLTGSRHPRDR